MSETGTCTSSRRQSMTSGSLSTAIFISRHRVASQCGHWSGSGDGCQQANAPWGPNVTSILAASIETTCQQSLKLALISPWLTLLGPKSPRARRPEGRARRSRSPHPGLCLGGHPPEPARGKPAGGVRFPNAGCPHTGPRSPQAALFPSDEETRRGVLSHSCPRTTTSRKLTSRAVDLQVDDGGASFAVGDHGS